MSNISESNSIIHMPPFPNHIQASLPEESWFKKKGLNIVHLNIQYLYSKLDELKLLFKSTNHIDILCICDTFLNEEFSNQEIQLESYQLFRKDRKTNGGGLVIYVKENLRCSLREDLNLDGIEAMWLEVKNNNQKAFILEYANRPSSSHQSWMMNFENNLRAGIHGKQVILLGDFHLYLLDISSSFRTWLQVTESVNLIQLVDMSTRVTESTSTIIDHAYSNKKVNRKVQEEPQAEAFIYSNY